MLSRYPPWFGAHRGDDGRTDREDLVLTIGHETIVGEVDSGVAA